ncbi:hypothetical protein WJX81_006750 [Elliptochloris bilobata]|uniref:TauD/TfdA-like domain-containing protein n=1 Tax=Elliptochloris bilobata TaxID=381761 RepID=A0AAW1S3R7_9CHLO
MLRMFSRAGLLQVPCGRPDTRSEGAYAKAVAAGAAKAALPVGTTLVLGVLAGVFIGFGSFLALSVGGDCPGLASANPGLQKMVLGAFGLPFGLLMVLVCGGELFTGNTALVTAAVYEGRATPAQLAKNWLVSYAGNFLGSALVVALVAASGVMATAKAPAAVAVAKTSLTFAQAFARGVLANWLVCVAVWQAGAASSLPGKFLGAWLPVSAFVALGLEHSIANMWMIPMGMPLPDLSPQALVIAHYREANEARKRLPPASHLHDAQRHSGPQGAVEPFTIIDDPSAWRAAEYAGREAEWLAPLTPSDIAELDAAVHAVEANPKLRQEGNHLHIQEVIPTSEQFALPTLGPKLQAAMTEVLSGRGFYILRGLPVERYTRKQIVIAYWGISLYWGNVVSQNAKGHIVGHVKNINHDVTSADTRVYATPLAQPIHTDSADAVGLLCLRPGLEGGLSSWASSVSVHNELLRRGRRDLVEELVRDQWYVDRKGEVPPGAAPYHKLPIFNYHKGFLSTNLNSTYYELAQRHAEVPRMTTKQREALAAVGALALGDELRMDFVLQPGDLQLISNFTQLHTRSAFTDPEALDQRRHLLRLWVAPPGERPLPDAYAALWGSTEPGKRGGINIGNNTLVVPLEAE